jgi:short-subunit dehydrogenase
MSGMSLPSPEPSTTVLITGASSGIGTELARQLAERGYNLVLVARRRERVEELAGALRARHGVAVNVNDTPVGDPEARGRLVATLQEGEREIVGVCNNAGFGTYGRFQDLDRGREYEEVRVNVDAVHHLSGAFLDGMLAQGAGAILNVASIAGFQPIPYQATYSATKAFVLTFSEALHADLSGTGVSCSALCPGPTRTEFVEVAEMERISGSAPGFLWQSAEDCARDGLEAMLHGRRTVVPRITNKLTSQAGRLTPRSMLLPIMRAVYGRG